MENKIIIGNMKMYMCIDDIKKYLINVESIITNNVIICPTSIYIPYFLDKGYNVGIQNISMQDSGAYTGEVSSIQASKLGIKWSIIGHSERREHFGETDIIINKKVKNCLKNNLNVILCVGETEEERNLLKTSIIIKQQLNIGLNGIEKKDQDKIIIAYEPRWAIGTDCIPNNKEIEDTIRYIKMILGQKNLKIKIIYGGSVNEKNIDLLNKIENVDGFLIGNCCIDSEKFKRIIDVVNSKDK